MEGPLALTIESLLADEVGVVSERFQVEVQVHRAVIHVWPQAVLVRVVRSARFVFYLSKVQVGPQGLSVPHSCGGTKWRRTHTKY